MGESAIKLEGRKETMELNCREVGPLLLGGEGRGRGEVIETGTW